MRGVPFRDSSARSAVSLSLEISGFKFSVLRRDEAWRIVHSLLPDNPRLSTKTLDSSYIDPCQLCDLWQICELEKMSLSIMAIRLVCTHLAALLDHLIPTTTLGGRLLSSHFIDEETGTPGG